MAGKPGKKERGRTRDGDNASWLKRNSMSIAMFLIFIEAVFENWESEFLQMAAFVFLSAILYQQGSPESRKLEGEHELDADPRREKREDGA